MPHNNPAGVNQHGGKLEYPEDWANILRGFRRRNLTKEEMRVELLADFNFTIGSRSLQTQLSRHTASTRNPKTSKEDAGAALVEMVAQDPHRQWGARLLKEKLARQDVHLNRDWINKFLNLLDPSGVAERRPGAKRVHRHGLYSIGPDEEWSMDGHDKLVPSMGIGIWGVVDKFSRLVLCHFAVPNNRLADVTLACYILLIQQTGGIPIRTVADKGSETGKIHSLQEALRQRYAPDLEIEVIPAAVHVKSTFNITVERQWKPLFQKTLANVLVFWLDNRGVYHPQDNLHQDIAHFIWAKVVQIILDSNREETASHKIRKQPQRFLPSGGSPSQFYRYPENYGGEACLIQIPPNDLAALVQEFVPTNLFFFCDEPTHHAATKGLDIIGNPELSPNTAWAVFAKLLPVVQDLLSTSI